MSITARDRKVVVVDEHGERREFHAEDPLRELETRITEYLSATRRRIAQVLRRGGRLCRVRHGPLCRAVAQSSADDRSLPICRSRFTIACWFFDQINKTVQVVCLLELRKLVGAGRGDRRRRAPTCLRHGVPESGRVVPEVKAGGDGAGRHRRGHQRTTGRTGEVELLREEFENAVRGCQEYIRAGDIFQVVLSQRFQWRPRETDWTFIERFAW